MWGIHGLYWVRCICSDETNAGLQCTASLGFDSFGLPGNNTLIKTGKHPGPFTDKLVGTI